ncbi:MAG: DUF2298 domain-containing protein, partial [Chloroflexota bacterium]
MLSASVLTWLLAAELLGLVGLPIAFALCPGLPDRGASLAMMLGWLLLGYLTWLAEILQFVDFTPPTVLFFLLLLAAGSAWLGWRQRSEMAAFVRRKWPLLAAYESIFLAAFGFMAWFRGFNPQIAGTEKPMDFALINGLLRSSHFPPMDPWMSGFHISYYYFGYYLVALLTRLTGVMPAIAFNLGLASVFSLAALGVAGLVYNLTRSLLAGLFGAFLALLASNPDGFARVLSYQTLAPSTYWWWWGSSRVLKSGCGGQCIDEFPQFSFLLGDLHPHVMALPLATLALGLSLAMLVRPGPLRWARSDWLPLAVLPVVAGSLGFANTWDLPTYLAILLMAILLSGYLHLRSLAAAGTESARSWRAFDWRAPLWVALAAGACYLPFYVGFQSQAGGVGLVSGQTTVNEFVRMWAFHFALAGVLLALLVRLRGWEAAALLGLAVALALVYRHWLAALVVPLALCCLLTVRNNLADGKWDAGHTFVLGLTAVAFGLIAVCEVVYLKDIFNNRMNTVFKFYYQAWLLLSIAGAYAGWEVWRRLRTAWPRWAWLGGLAGLCVVAGTYSAASFHSKANGFTGPWTLNGSAYLRQSDPGDAAAIAWLNSHVAGDAVIAEATGPEYSQYARFGTFTGLESVLGWAGHELQWRGVWKEEPVRIQDLQHLYT